MTNSEAFVYLMNSGNPPFKYIVAALLILTVMAHIWIWLNADKFIGPTDKPF